MLTNKQSLSSACQKNAEAGVDRHGVEGVDACTLEHDAAVVVVEAELEDAVVEIEHRANRVEAFARWGVEDVRQRLAGAHHRRSELSAPVRRVVGGGEAHHVVHAALRAVDRVHDAALSAGRAAVWSEDLHRNTRALDRAAVHAEGCVEEVDGALGNRARPCGRSRAMAATVSRRAQKSMSLLRKSPSAASSGTRP